MKLNKAFALRVREILKEKKMMQYKLAKEIVLSHSIMIDILIFKYQHQIVKHDTNYQVLRIISKRILL